MRRTTLGVIAFSAVVILVVPSVLRGQGLPIPLPLGDPGAPPLSSPTEPSLTNPEGSPPLDIEAESRPADANTSQDPDPRRDPFWPVGYTPKPRVVTTTTNMSGTASSPLPEERPVPINWDAARKILDIRGIGLIGRERQTNTAKYLAMIGGKLTEVGDIVSVSYMSRLYRWKVTAISPDGISLAKLDVRPE